MEEEELAQIYMRRGLSEGLARQVARELSDGDLIDVVKVHARDELGKGVFLKLYRLKRG
jgi:ribosomal protein S25